MNVMHAPYIATRYGERRVPVIAPKSTDVAVSGQVPKSVRVVAIWVPPESNAMKKQV